MKGEKLKMGEKELLIPSWEAQGVGKNFVKNELVGGLEAFCHFRTNI
jgi:hypothetical protein